MLVAGQRYLFLSYGPLSYSGVFRRVVEVGPGIAALELSDVECIGETGPIQDAVSRGVYADGQHGPNPAPVMLLPWHDISSISPQGV